MKDKLSDLKCKTCTPGKHFDGGGLYLLVLPAGGRCWRLKYRHGGKVKTLALDVYPTVKLKEARDKRGAAKKVIVAGVDPIQQRREAEAALWAGAQTATAKGTVFATVADMFYENAHRLWSASHRRDVHRMIDEMLPAIGTIARKSVERTLVRNLRARLASAHRILHAINELRRPLFAYPPGVIPRGEGSGVSGL